MAELKPCPFCGESLILVKGYWMHDMDNTDCFLCHICFDEDDEKSIAQWNRRV